MKYYLQFNKDGSYLHGVSPNQKRCNIATSPNGKTFVATQGFRTSQHVVEAENEAAAVIALGLVAFVAPARTARQILAEAERTGLDVTVGSATYRIKCAESDRSAFAQRATLVGLAYKKYQQTSQAAADAYMQTETVITDALGVVHTMTLEQYEDLILAYGAAFELLWQAAVTQ